MAGEYLDDVVERAPMIDHEGKFGALLERVTLAGGRHLIVKRFSPETDLLMAVLGDVVGREYDLSSRGILDMLPPKVGHVVVDEWVDGDGGDRDAGLSSDWLKPPEAVRRRGSTAAPAAALEPARRGLY